MIFPIGDNPNPPGTPLVTYLLIGINVAVFLVVTLPFSAMEPDLNDPLLLEYLRTLGVRGAVTAEEVLHYFSAYDLLVYRFGFRPAEFSLVSLFTSLFLHGGFLHLAGNMLFLWIFGDNVEHRLGRAAFLGSYLFFGVAATLFFALFAQDSQIPLVGASGAISGVLGCYFLWFPRNQVRCFIFLFPFLITTLMIPARIVLAFYLLVDNLLPFVTQEIDGGGIAHGAHIGGFIGGLGLAAAAQYGAGLLGRGTGVKRPGPPSCEPEALGEMISRGEMATASRCYLGYREKEQRLRVTGDDVLKLGEYLLQSGDHRAALVLFRRFIAERQTDPQLARAYLGAGYALLAQPRYATSAYHYFLAALDLARNPDLADEARSQLRHIEKMKRGSD